MALSLRFRSIFLNFDDSVKVQIDLVEITNLRLISMLNEARAICRDKHSRHGSVQNETGARSFLRSHLKQLSYLGGALRQKMLATETLSPSRIQTNFRIGQNRPRGVGPSHLTVSLRGQQLAATAAPSKECRKNKSGQIFADESTSMKQN